MFFQLKNPMRRLSTTGLNILLSGHNCLLLVLLVAGKSNCGDGLTENLLAAKGFDAMLCF
jgi:hypothetical protein